METQPSWCAGRKSNQCLTNRQLVLQPRQKQEPVQLAPAQEPFSAAGFIRNYNHALMLLSLTTRQGALLTTFRLFTLQPSAGLPMAYECFSTTYYYLAIMLAVLYTEKPKYNKLYRITPDVFFQYSNHNNNL